MVNKDKCFECDSINYIHYHHVVPQSKGGTKTIPLCEMCHGKVHGIDFTNHGILTKEGLKRAKENGVKLGNSQNFTNKGRQKGLNTIMKNKLKDSNWITCKNFIENFIKINGKINYTHISNSLNEQGYKTRKGSIYTPSTVRRIHLDFTIMR
jgi:hypothetical protein